MDFNSKPIVLQTFFTDKIYKVPRYQREYSWTKQQLEDFYSDIVSNIIKEEGCYKTQEYFFGTVILVGNMEKPNEAIEIIDGQQRITTITILLLQYFCQYYRIYFIITMTIYPHYYGNI